MCLHHVHITIRIVGISFVGRSCSSILGGNWRRLFWLSHHGRARRKSWRLENKRGEKESREIKGDSYNGPHYLVLFAKLNLIRSVIVRVREILKRTVVSD